MMKPGSPFLAVLLPSSHDLISHATVRNRADVLFGDLARALSLPKPSMTFLVKKLEASGYLRRQGEKGDLRRYRLTITPAGKKARDKGSRSGYRNIRRLS